MLSKEERAIRAASARWGKKAIAEGAIQIGDLSISCFVLNTKERVIATPSLLAAFRMKDGGYKTGDRRIVRFAKTEGMAKYIDDELLVMLENPIKIKTSIRGRALAYPAEVLPKLCSSILNAQADNSLKLQQKHIAEQARILMNGFANIGVIGLIDEATGYQYVRERDALAVILEQFVAKEAAVWVKTFPDEFYREMFRLRGIEPNDLHKRPKYFGSLTHDIVYSRLAPQVVEELKKRNPKDPEGKRLHRHHQWLTKNKGYHKLETHLEKLIAYMHVSKDWNAFMKLINKYVPIQPTVTSE